MKNKNALAEADRALLRKFHLLNEEGQEKLVDYADDLVKSEKYKKLPPLQMATEA